MMNSDRQISKVNEDLNKTYRNISDSKLRIWLLRSLMSWNLSTRDVYSFVKRQSELRSVIKTLDRRTMTEAMRTKLKDIKLLLARHINKKKRLEACYKGETSVAKMKMKEMKRTVNEEKKKKAIKYQNKIEHYQTRQEKIRHQQAGRKKKDHPHCCSTAPETI